MTPRGQREARATLACSRFEVRCPQAERSRSTRTGKPCAQAFGPSAGPPRSSYRRSARTQLRRPPRRAVGPRGGARIEQESARSGRDAREAAQVDARLGRSDRGRGAEEAASASARRPGGSLGGRRPGAAGGGSRPRTARRWRRCAEPFAQALDEGVASACAPAKVVAVVAPHLEERVTRRTKDCCSSSVRLARSARTGTVRSASSMTRDRNGVRVGPRLGPVVGAVDEQRALAPARRSAWTIGEAHPAPSPARVEFGPGHRELRRVAHRGAAGRAPIAEAERGSGRSIQPAPRRR
jgi:hypothetical protein